MEKVILFGISLLATVHLNGQSIAPQSVNSAGKQSVVNNAGIGFTIGELVVITQSDSQGNTINGGFTSGASLSTVSLIEPDSQIIGLTFFPNPTIDILSIKLKNNTLDQFLITITDLNGKEIYFAKYNHVAQFIQINFRDYSSGEYLLNLKSTSNEIIGSYKVIKP
jgi:hypothetical protein